MIFEQAWSDLIKAIDMPDDLNFMINEIESINPFARRDGTTAEFLAHADPAAVMDVLDEDRWNFGGSTYRGPSAIHLNEATRDLYRDPGIFSYPANVFARQARNRSVPFSVFEGDLVEGGVIDRYLQMAEDQGRRAILGALSMNPNTGKIGMMTRLPGIKRNITANLAGAAVDRYGSLHDSLYSVDGYNFMRNFGNQIVGSDPEYKVIDYDDPMDYNNKLLSAQGQGYAFDTPLKLPRMKRNAGGSYVTDDQESTPYDDREKDFDVTSSGKNIFHYPPESFPINYRLGVRRVDEDAMPLFQRDVIAGWPR